MVTTEERVSRLEGGYEHLATKADLANLKADLANLKANLANLKTDLYRAIIQLGILMTAIVGAAVAFLKLTA